MRNYVSSSITALMFLSVCSCATVSNSPTVSDSPSRASHNVSSYDTQYDEPAEQRDNDYYFKLTYRKNLILERELNRLYAKHKDDAEMIEKMAKHLLTEMTKYNTSESEVLWSAILTKFNERNPDNMLINRMFVFYHWQIY